MQDITNSSYDVNFVIIQGLTSNTGSRINLSHGLSSTENSRVFLYLNLHRSMSHLDNCHLGSTHSPASATPRIKERKEE